MTILSVEALLSWFGSVQSSDQLCCQADMIQQRSSSGLFCGRPTWAILAWAGKSIVILSTQHFSCWLWHCMPIQRPWVKEVQYLGIAEYWISEHFLIVKLTLENKNHASQVERSWPPPEFTVHWDYSDVIHAVVQFPDGPWSHEFHKAFSALWNTRVSSQHFRIPTLLCLV